MFPIRTLLLSVTFATLAGCQATGQQYAANTYAAGQVNQRQEVHTVRILAVLPAKVTVNNEQAQKTAQVAGALLGAIVGGAIGHGVGDHSATNTTVGAAAGGIGGAVSGSLVPGTALVEGVQITYSQSGKTFNSAQVGRVCEFVPGDALLVSSGGNETRIQPNAACPVEKKS